MPSADRSRSSAYLLVVALVALGGFTLTWSLWREAGAQEEFRRDAEFERQVTARHALIRETLSGYEDSLLALKLLLTYHREISRPEFADAVDQQRARHPGFLGVQWAPAVTAAERVSWETAHTAEIPGGIRERVRGGRDAPAIARDLYYPIKFAEPLEANRHVLGSDAASSPLRADIERTQSSPTCIISGLLKLVYESGPNDGVIMMCAVPPTANRPATGPGGAGVLLGVFRVADLLTQPWDRFPGRPLDVLFLDESATRPDRRVLYSRIAAGGSAPTETQFRTGLHREIILPLGGRTWRLLYRPTNGPGSPETSTLPVIVLFSGLVITTLGSAFLASRLRRVELVEQAVDERTAELSESRRQLSSLMHSLPGMAFRGHYQESFTVLYASEGATSLTGWSPEEFVAGRVRFHDVVHPDDLGPVREATLVALRKQKDFAQEFRIRTRCGSEKWVQSGGRGVYDRAGKLTMIEGLVIDITAKRLAEQERLTMERRLLEGQKLESLGLLAGGIAHDFNNLLAIIIGNSSLLRLEPARTTETEAKFTALETAAQRASDLCIQMLAYAGKGRFVIEPADLTALVESLVPLFHVSIARQADLNLSLARDLPAVRADTTQLRQIMMNLVLNAADAIGGRGGQISVTTGVMSVDSTFLAACATGCELPPGDFVFLEVRDNGCGMPPAVRAKIFDPFFTTKFTGRGLGLAATLGIVRGHHGALHVETTLGTGSTFRLLLPAEPGVIVAKPQPKPVPSSWKFTGRALVIDDDEPVRIVAAGMLKSVGASVHACHDGQSGIEAFRASPSEFDVVLLDLLMPGLSGEDTLKVLRTIRPDIRVLIISGVSEMDVMQRLAGDRGPFLFLRKPFNRGALVSALRELLG